MKNVPFVMPATHGDPSTPYYDLPAGNMMPHIVPNSAIPINPKLVKPLQFVAGPADDSLVNSLKDFMKEVEHIDGIGVDFDGGGMLDFDELGQACAKDPVSGEIIDGEGYYGWSRGFCQKMKRRKAGKVASNPSGRTRSTSSDRDVGRRKRRRDHSGSRSGRSSGHGRSRFSSFSRSRSKSPDRTLMKRYGQQEKRYSRSRSKSGSSSRSRSPPQRYRSLRSRSRTSPRSRSKSYSPPHELPPEQDPDPYEYNPGAIPDRPHGPSRPGPPQLPANFGQGFPLGPGGIPIPPPPPPNHTGPWPPPPPPIPAGINFIPQPGQFPPLFPGFVPPHIPGPPSGPRNPPGQVPHGSGRWSQQQQYQQQGGRGGYGGYGPSDPGAVHNYNGRGRGGPRGAWRS